MTENLVRVDRSILMLLMASLAGICLTTNAMAIDIITRKSQENRISGEVTSISKTAIKVKQQTGAEVEIPANDIELIEWDAAPATLKAAIGQEANGNYDAAISSLQTVLDGLPVTATNVRTDTQFFIARALAKAALADSARMPEAVARMKAFTDGNITSFRYYEAIDYLGRLYLATNDYTQAEAAFTSLENSPFDDWKLSAQSSKARVMLAQNQVDQALSAFDAVLKAPAKDESSKQRQLEAKLGKAKCLNIKNQYDQALTLLADVISNAQESDSRLQGEAQVLRGTALLGQGKTQEAILAYLLVDILFSGQQDYHAEALYNLAKLWPAVGQPGRAEEARASLETKYPNSPWTKKLSGV
ncbi:MAG TPA: hypothetical protein DD473_17510 [Planctomycetaceae bacterium]|nr:hypothetical protein [Planctomycetaceae bacterium]